MNSQGNFKDDRLGEFIYPEKIEKAPDGFTSKVMTQIHLERVPLKQAEKSPNRNLVPYISVAVTILLIVATFIMPTGKSDSLSLLLLEQFKNLKITLPAIDLSSFFSLSLPSIIIYVFIGILILSLFDIALSGIFRREK